MIRKSERVKFRKEVAKILDFINPEYLSYDESEFWMVQGPYEYIEYYAIENHMINTCIALPLARGLHDGTHRKSSIMKDGKSYRLPYLIHVLIVCRILLDLNIALPNEEVDIILASALCHDMIEDIPFDNHGEELVTECHLDPRVYHTVKLVSKKKDFTPEEEMEHIHNIESDPYALLVKLSDRSHNVEDLYNMKFWKVHEYVEETERLILPMCAYGIEHFPEIAMTIEILQDKIMSLLKASVILIDRYEAREQRLIGMVNELKRENEKLRDEFREIWEE